MLHISIIGYGKMGHLVEEVAKAKKNISIVSIIDPHIKEATHKTINQDSMKHVDVCICFAQPQVAVSIIKDICFWKKPLVMATTGWIKLLDDVRKLVDDAGIGMVYSSNFSLGVNLFFKLLESASQLLNAFEDYDVMGLEFHHRRKLDSPSGTAKTMIQILLENMDRKKHVVEEKLDRKINSDELHFASVRGGDIPGTHSVIFDSEFDSIELKHTARSRNGFAIGSLLAAKWILDKKGLFTEKDIIQSFT